jgi:hypothetical protein
VLRQVLLQGFRAFRSISPQGPPSGSTCRTACASDG